MSRRTRNDPFDPLNIDAVNESAIANEIVIHPRFCGPPNCGNGGYVSGLLAQSIGDAAEVTLRRPPPLAQPLEITIVEGTDAGTTLLRDGRTVVAEARPIELHVATPRPPSYAEAEDASWGYMGFQHHPFPTCFVCGPERTAGDGLLIFPGAIPERRIVAAPWIPHDSLADSLGFIRPEFLWAALDCSGCFAALTHTGPRPMVLGQIAAQVEPHIQPGEKCVIVGWRIASQGRKHRVGTALFAKGGERCGFAVATWIEVPSSV